MEDSLSSPPTSTLTPAPQELPPAQPSKTMLQTETPEQAPEPEPKENKNLFWIIVGILAAGIVGAGAYLLLKDNQKVLNSLLGKEATTGTESEGESGEGSQEGESEPLPEEEEVDYNDADASEDPAEDGTPDPNDPYQGWATYVHASTDPDCALVVRHPTDWTATSTGDSVQITKDNYTWNFDFDPLVTGGGFGYMMGEPVPPSDSLSTNITVDGYPVEMVTQYISLSDLVATYGNSISSDFNIQENTWEGTVAFTDPDNLGFGFGPGDMYDDNSCDYYVILYLYNSQTGDFSDLPVKGDAPLNQMLTTMDRISESVDLN